MNKIEMLRDELNYIKNERIKRSAENLIELVPDYFFEVPASSTGKYHPNFSQGSGGLLRHTKVATAIANEILSLEYTNNLFTEDEKDLMILGIIVHDSQKLGNPKETHTRFDHPLLAASFIEENKEEMELTSEEIAFLKRVISSHMGQWNKNSYSNIELPKPTDKYEFFVHLCDYLSSKKFLDVKFEENNRIRRR
jgi:23S rRNA maturation-related 3'-5' exoribonuclease YhaM